MVFCPIFPHREYTPTEIKNGVKAAYYEIKKEEAIARAEKEAKEKREAERRKFENEFDEIVGNILINGEELKF